MLQNKLNDKHCTCFIWKMNVTTTKRKKRNSWAKIQEVLYQPLEFADSPNGFRFVTMQSLTH